MIYEVFINFRILNRWTFVIFFRILSKSFQSGYFFSVFDLPLFTKGTYGPGPSNITGMVVKIGDRYHQVSYSTLHFGARSGWLKTVYFCKTVHLKDRILSSLFNWLRLQADVITVLVGLSTGCLSHDQSKIYII